MAAREPPYLSLLAGLGLEHALSSLPGWPTLFYERDYKVHTMHKSVNDWLGDPQVRKEGREGGGREGEDPTEGGGKGGTQEAGQSESRLGVQLHPTRPAPSCSWLAVGPVRFGRLRHVPPSLTCLPALPPSLPPSLLQALYEFRDAGVGVHAPMDQVLAACGAAVTSKA